jgi:hypothetical protein
MALYKLKPLHARVSEHRAARIVIVCLSYPHLSRNYVLYHQYFHEVFFWLHSLEFDKNKEMQTVVFSCLEDYS